jgi:tRNA pseudouridine38-40 synthase
MFCLLAVFKFGALLFFEKTLAFSPSSPKSSLHYGPHGARKCFDSSRLKSATDGAKLYGENNSTESYPIWYNPSYTRFRCRIAYDGTSFAGFQLQGGRKGSNAEKVDTGTSNSHSLGDSSAILQTHTKKKRKHDKINNNPRTIQGEVEKVLSKRFQRLIKVIGAGRTDGGVHARGQAIHFDLYHNETIITKTDLSSKADDSSFERNLEVTMNRMLPSDIRAWNLGRASPTLVIDTGSKYTPPGWYNWNAMRTCTSKLYSYRICIGDAMNPSERHHRWQLPWHGLSPQRLEKVLHSFEGEHDFVCFAGALEQQEKKTGIVRGTVRTIHKIKLVKEANAKNNEFQSDDNRDDMGGDDSQNNYRIDIYLDGALYKMVRNIVGTAIDVSRGWLDEETFVDLLNRPSELNYTRRNNPSKPAPSNGLTLERVFYPDEMEF